MATLDEIRALLRAQGIGDTKPRNIRDGEVEWDLSGEADHLEGFTDKALSNVDLSKMAASRAPKFTVSADGSDALVRFGKHDGKTISQIYEIEPSYVAWMIKEFRGKSLAADFVEICEHVVKRESAISVATRPPRKSWDGKMPEKEKPKFDFDFDAEPKKVPAFDFDKLKARIAARKKEP